MPSATATSLTYAEHLRRNPADMIQMHWAAADHMATTAGAAERGVQLYGSQQRQCARQPEPYFLTI